MFAMEKTKTQGGETRRANRLPPGQSGTKKWPIRDASGAPTMDRDLDGLVAHPISWNWHEFQALPRVSVWADFHCVTRWSRLGDVWEGVAMLRDC